MPARFAAPTRTASERYLRFTIYDLRAMKNSRTDHRDEACPVIGGQRCAATLSARAAGTGTPGQRRTRGSAAPALRWAAEWSQRDHFHLKMSRRVRSHPQRVNRQS
jgi:hypothetical protein